MVKEANRRGKAISGKKVASVISPCHLGRNPRKGGRLARDRNIVDSINLVVGDSDVIAEIFWEDRFRV